MNSFNQLWHIALLHKWELDTTMLIDSVLKYMFEDVYEYGEDEPKDELDEDSLIELAYELHTLLTNVDNSTCRVDYQPLTVEQIFGKTVTKFAINTKTDTLDVITTGTDKFGYPTKVLLSIQKQSVTVPQYINDILDGTIDE